MADKKNNILKVVDGANKPSMHNSSTQNSTENSITDDLYDDLKVATWEWNSKTESSVWTPLQPTWLPTTSLGSLSSFLLHVHSQDQEFLRQAINDTSQHTFETQLRIRNDDKKEIWVHINGRRSSDQPEIVTLAIRDVSAIKSLQHTLQQQIRRHQEMVRDTEAVAMEFSLADFSIKRIDRHIEALLGYPYSDWLRRTSFLKESVLDDDWYKFEELASSRETDDERFAIEFRIREASGNIRWLRCSGRIIPSGKNAATVARGVFQDITESQIAIEAQMVSEKQLNILYDHNPSMFFSMDPDGVLLSANQYGAEHLGYRPEALVGINALELHLPSQRNKVREHFKECLAAAGEIHHWETCLLRKDKTPLWVRVASRIVIDENQDASMLAVCEDISEARALSDKLEYQSHFDILTGLVNRSSFERNLNDALVTATENHWEHVLCYLDLDQFKIVNDTCGHSAGDQMLRKVGHILSRYLREEDVLARLGGDEFGILFYRCNLENAAKRAEQIIRSLAEQRFKWGENNFRLTASVGIVAITDRSQSTEQLLSIADTACYTAKDNGRNRIFCYQEDDDVEITRRHGEMSWVARLQAALDGDGFEIYSQIIQPLDMREENTTAVEILLRLKGYEGDVVLPDRFIRAAESYSIATRLDHWVCEYIIDYFENHPEQLRPLDFLCINLSAQSVCDEEFQKKLTQLLEYKADIAHKLCFEITETGVIENISAATDFIDSLKTLGCRFALDDFGSGVSSFAYLKNLAVDIVKIDGMFVRNIVNSQIDRALVGSINEIGHAMGKQTIAEFVEDEDTQKCLKQLGVDYAQGFHIHKPQPLVEHLSSLSQ